jgi:hypothetical protein
MPSRISIKCEADGTVLYRQEDGRAAPYPLIVQAKVEHRAAILAMLHGALKRSEALLQLGSPTPPPAFAEPPVFEVLSEEPLPEEPVWHEPPDALPKRTLALWLQPAEWNRLVEENEGRRRQAREAYEKACIAWKVEAAAVRQRHSERAHAHDLARDAALAAFEQRKKIIEEGTDAEAVRRSVKAQIGRLDWAEQLMVDCAIKEPCVEARVLLDVPTVDLFEPVCPRSGVVDENALCLAFVRPDTEELHRRYGTFVLVATLSVASAVLAAAPSIQTLDLTTVVDDVRPGADEIKRPVISTRISRSEWTSRWKYPHAPLHELRRFDTRCRLSGDWQFGDLVPWSAQSQN